MESQKECPGEKWKRKGEMDGKRNEEKQTKYGTPRWLVTVTASLSNRHGCRWI